jgi:hypothetical protein
LVKEEFEKILNEEQYHLNYINPKNVGVLEWYIDNKNPNFYRLYLKLLFKQYGKLIISRLKKQGETWKDIYGYDLFNASELKKIDPKTVVSDIIFDFLDDSKIINQFLIDMWDEFQDYEQEEIMSDSNWVE